MYRDIYLTLLNAIKKSCNHIVVLILLAFSFHASSEVVLDLSSQGGEVDLKKYLVVMEGASDRLNLEEVRRSETKFKPYLESPPSTQLSNIDFWARFTFKTDDRIGPWFFVNNFQNTHYIDVYILDSLGRKIKEVETGAFRPFATRDIPYLKFAFGINSKPYSEYTVYVNVRSEAVVNFDWVLQDQESFLTSKAKHQTIQGVFYGIVLLLILFNFGLAVFNRVKSGYFISLYFFFFSLFYFSVTGGTSAILPGSLSAFSGLAVKFSVCLSIAFLMAYFCETLRFDQQWKRASVRGLYIYWLALTVVVALLSYRASIILMIVSFIASPIIVISIGIESWKKLTPDAKTIFVGAVFFYSTATLWVVALALNLPLGFINRYGLEFVLVGVLATMTIGLLFQRFKLVVDHRASLEALGASQLKLNAFLDQTNHFFALFNLDGEIVAFNKAAAEFEGVPAEKLYGKKLWEVTKFSDIEDNAFRIKHAFESAAQGTAETFEVHYPDDAKFVMQATFWPYKNGEEIEFVVGQGRDVTEIKQSSQMVKDISLGVSEYSGDKFFEYLVVQLAQIVAVKSVLVGRLESSQVSTLAHSVDGRLIEPCDYLIRNSLFEDVLDNNARYVANIHESGYPHYGILKTIGANSYLVIPLTNSENHVVGVLGLFNDTAINEISEINDILQIFISRAEAELERNDALEALRRASERLSLHTQNTPLACIEFDIELRITDWNPAAVHIFGYSREDAIGLPIIGFLTEDSASDDLWHSIMSNRNGHFSRITNITKDNNEIICDWYNTLLIDDQGDVFGVASLVVNVTAEFEATKALRYKEHEQSEMLDSMVDAVLTITETGVVQSFNKAAENMFGYHASEMIGENVVKLVPSNAESEENYFISNYFDSSDESTIGLGREVVANRRNGSEFPMRLLVAELPKHGGLRRFVCSCHDLSKIKSQEEQLRRSQKMDALGKLTGGIAHDFNNLLGVIMGYSDLLRNMLYDQPKLKNYGDEIYIACERGAKLTKKLLATSKRQSLEASEVDLNEILVSGQNMLQRVLTSGIRLNYDLCDEPLPIFIDKGDFEDALLNLCINAAHSMNDRGDLDINTERVYFGDRESEKFQLPKGNYGFIAVRDYGCGISQKNLDKIFDPFFSTKGDKGTGLGLGQVYGFVERSKGRVLVDSILSEGTVFSMYFPLLENEPIKLPETTNTDVVLGGDEVILLVDDEASLLKVTKETLSNAGYIVKTASNAREALIVLNQQNIRLMISDVIMPDIDGYQLATRVKSLYPKVKIQLASGFTDNRIPEDIKECFGHNILQKPYSTTNLLKRIREIFDSVSE